MTIGATVAPERWKELVAAACGGEWIVQEYCELRISASVSSADDGTCSVQDWQFSLDIFMLEGRAIGLTSRSNQGDVINVGSGGSAGRYASSAARLLPTPTPQAARHRA